MFWETFYKLCKEKGTSPNAVAKEIGVSSGAVTTWKKGKIPHAPTLKKIADYFNVTVDYLLGKEEKAEKKEKLPASNEEFMKMLREYNNGTAQIFFCGADGKVVEVPPEAEAILKSVIDTFNKKDS